MSTHHIVCGFYPKKNQDIPPKYSCNICEFETQNENQLKRHQRDKHDTSTASTSPKRKRRKHSENVESMVVDEPLGAENPMEIDESEDILAEQSKFWDEKIKMRNEKYEAEQRILLEKKEEKQLQKKKNN